MKTECFVLREGQLDTPSHFPVDEFGLTTSELNKR